MRKALVVAPSWIGDTILAQPLLVRLHEKHPGLALDAFAPAWAAPVLARMREVRRVVPNPFAHGEFNLAGRWRAGRELAREGYDVALVLPNSWKSALVPCFAGIPQRIGFMGEARRGLLNRIHRLDEAALPQLAQRYALLAEDVGTTAPAPLAAPHIEVNPESVRATLAALGLDANKPPVAFCPGAEYGPAKRWPARHFAELARRLAQTDFPVWIVGSGKDRPIGAEIAQLAGGAARNLCGKTDLGQAIDLLSCARLVVSNDSGLMHVAAALDRPLLALYGSSSTAYTPPLSRRARLLSLGLECSPCFRRECPLGHFKCLNDLTPERVLGEIQGALS
ncbi:MAG: lipopolysaccharide heptosyltransferase II [Rhodocyclaceae bacterium]|nr:MAG: lipopolysaccharide heptosyltransferase II [Rhodocyclaceae bacterium]CAG0944845.1 heptosyltransferase II [Gammaproteobacteria bacterium]